MQVSEIMTRAVVWVGPDTDIRAAATLMVKHRVSGLPVLEDDGRLVGVITEGDLLRRIETGTGEDRRTGWRGLFESSGRLAARYVHAHSQRVADLMTTDVASVAPNADLRDVVALMTHRQIKRLPVVCDGKLLGIVSRSDFVGVVARGLVATDGPRTDAELEERVRANLSAQPWIGACNVGITARNGTVRLEGLYYDERVRQALLVAARSIAGEAVLEDRLVWSNPTARAVLAAQPRDAARHPNPKGVRASAAMPIGGSDRT